MGVDLYVLCRRVRKLIAEHGGVRPAARALGIDPSYLVRLRDGTKDNPSDDTLARLGLERVPTPDRLTTRNADPDPGYGWHPLYGEPQPVVVYQAISRTQQSAYFGEWSAARAWAGENGSVTMHAVRAITEPEPVAPISAVDNSADGSRPGEGEPARYFASGPFGCFFTDNLALASRLVTLIEHDRDEHDEWTVTDLHNPTGGDAFQHPDALASRPAPVAITNADEIGSRLVGGAAPVGGGEGTMEAKKALGFVYDHLCAMDNGDLPLEAYPQKVVDSLAGAGWAVVPCALPFAVLGEAGMMLETGNPKFMWDFLLTKTRIYPRCAPDASIAACYLASPVSSAPGVTEEMVERALGAWFDTVVEEVAGDKNSARMRSALNAALHGDGL